MSGRGGEPVIELQTNFGGGKTHTLLAVYHLATNGCGHAGRVTLPGMDDVLRIAEVESVPKAKVAVIDGNALAPNQPARIGELDTIDTDIKLSATIINEQYGESCFVCAHTHVGMCSWVTSTTAVDILRNRLTHYVPGVC